MNKIAFCSEVGIISRSAETIFTMKVCEAYANIGHDVILIVPNQKDENICLSKDEVYKYYGVEKIFDIVRLPWPPILGRRMMCGVLAALLAKFRSTDLLHSRSLQAALAASYLKIPCIFESHTPLCETGACSKWQFRQLLKNKYLKRIVVITDALKDYYQQQYNISQDLFTVAPDAADEETETSKEIIWSKGQLQVGYIGQLYQGRGVEIILKLAQNCPWADFHLIGGEEKAIDYWKANTANIRNIFFHGFVPPAQLGQYRQSFDVLLAPYEKKVAIGEDGKYDSSRWMSPMKIFEYMAAGKAMICSDLPVIREVLENNKSAILCDPEDISSWIAALTKLKNDHEFRKKLADQAFQQFKLKHTWIKRMENILEGLAIDK